MNNPIYYIEPEPIVSQDDIIDVLASTAGTLIKDLIENSIPGTYQLNLIFKEAGKFANIALQTVDININNDRSVSIGDFVFTAAELVAQAGINAAIAITLFGTFNPTGLAFVASTFAGSVVYSVLTEIPQSLSTTSVELLDENGTLLGGALYQDSLFDFDQGTQATREAVQALLAQSGQEIQTADGGTVNFPFASSGMEVQLTNPTIDFAEGGINPNSNPLSPFDTYIVYDGNIVTNLTEEVGLTQETFLAIDGFPTMSQGETRIENSEYFVDIEDNPLLFLGDNDRLNVPIPLPKDGTPIQAQKLILGLVGSNIYFAEDQTPPADLNLSDANLFVGSEGNDSWAAGAELDVLFGGAGNDSLSGDAGNDIIYAGDGANVLIGGAGDDSLFGVKVTFDSYTDQNSENTLQWIDNGTPDTLVGSEGVDTFFIGNGDVVIDSGEEDAIYALLPGTNVPVLVSGSGEGANSNSLPSLKLPFVPNNPLFVEVGLDTVPNMPVNTEIEDFEIDPEGSLFVSSSPSLAYFPVSRDESLNLTYNRFSEGTVLQSGNGFISFIRTADFSPLTNGSFGITYEHLFNNEDYEGDYFIVPDSQVGTSNDTWYQLMVSLGIEPFDSPYEYSEVNPALQPLRDALLATGEFDGSTPPGIDNSSPDEENPDSNPPPLDPSPSPEEPPVLIDEPSPSDDIDEEVDTDVELSPITPAQEVIAVPGTTNGDDPLEGADADEILDGGAGDDTLEGGFGNDTYIIEPGNGNDIIADLGAPLDVDVLEIGANPDNVTIIRDGNNAILTLDSTGEQITIQGQFFPSSSGIRRIEEFLFADGSLLTARDIELDLLSQATTSGNDVIDGFYGDDLLDGGAGNDTLEGGFGSDTYIYGAGYGIDRILELGSAVDTDVVQFQQGISPNQIDILRNEDDLILYLDDNNVVIVQDQFRLDFASRRIEEVRFVSSSDTIWTNEFLEENAELITIDNDEPPAYLEEAV